MLCFLTGLAVALAAFVGLVAVILLAGLIVIGVSEHKFPDDWEDCIGAGVTGLIVLVALGLACVLLYGLGCGVLEHLRG